MSFFALGQIAGALVGTRFVSALVRAGIERIGLRSLWLVALLTMAVWSAWLALGTAMGWITDALESWFLWAAALLFWTVYDLWRGKKVRRAGGGGVHTPNAMTPDETRRRLSEEAAEAIRAAEERSKG